MPRLATTLLDPDLCPHCGPVDRVLRHSPLRPGGAAPPDRACNACLKARDRRYPFCGECRALMVGGRDGVERYCARCPGPGKVEVTLLHPGDGRERATWHPEAVLAARQEASGRTQLVSRASTERDWRVGRLGPPPRRRSRRRTVQVECHHCGEKFRRETTAWTRSQLPKCCSACRRKLNSTYSARWRARTKRTCLCGRKDGRRKDGRCSSCLHRSRKNGDCASCGAPRMRDAFAPPWCPRCDPPPRRKREQVMVRVVDGAGDEQERWVESTVPLGGPALKRWARAWVAPVVLVPRLGVRRKLEGAVVISGLYLPGSGPTSRSLLPGLVARPARSWEELKARVRAELGDEKTSAFSQLLRAGFVTREGQVTERARGVVRWAALAGVRL